MQCVFCRNPDTFINSSENCAGDYRHRHLADSDDDEESDIAQSRDLIDFANKTATMKSKYVLTDDDLGFACPSDSDSSDEFAAVAGASARLMNAEKTSDTPAENTVKALRPKRKRSVAIDDSSDVDSDDNIMAPQIRSASNKNERSPSPDTQEFTYVESKEMRELRKKTKEIRNQAESLMDDSIMQEDTYPESVVLKIRRSTTKNVKLLPVNSASTFGDIKLQYCQLHMKSIKDTDSYRLIIPSEGIRVERYMQEAGREWLR